MYVVQLHAGKIFHVGCILLSGDSRSRNAASATASSVYL